MQLQEVSMSALDVLKHFIARPLNYRLEISISDCAHYCGFRYGVGAYNPYENYLLDIVGGIGEVRARERFIDFLRHYRPRHMAMALGITLSREYPLWIYPWQYFTRRQFSARRAWLDHADQCPDILTHFSDQGVLEFRVNEEFVWLERALYSIASEGYQPARYGYARTIQLRRRDNVSVYLMLDGNHRLSAMSALGQRVIRVQQNINNLIREDHCDRWYGVQQGYYTVGDALAIFHAYFAGNHHYHTTEVSAPILQLNEVL